MIGRTDMLKQFLDGGGQLVIKNNAEDKMMVVTEAEIEGKKYHKGLLIETSEEIISRWDEIIESSLVALRKVKTKLSLQGN